MITAVIGCTKRKMEGKHPAFILYSESDYFKSCLRYAHKKADRIIILSAKHGAIKPDEIIEQYDDTLNKKSESYKKEWALKLLEKFKSLIGKDDIIWLCGNNYKKHLSKMIENNQSHPLEGLGIGKQLQLLKKL